MYWGGLHLVTYIFTQRAQGMLESIPAHVPRNGDNHRLQMDQLCYMRMHTEIHTAHPHPQRPCTHTPPSLQITGGTISCLNP